MFSTLVAQAKGLDTRPTEERAFAVQYDAETAPGGLLWSYEDAHVKRDVARLLCLQSRLRNGEVPGASSVRRASIAALPSPEAMPTLREQQQRRSHRRRPRPRSLGTAAGVAAEPEVGVEQVELLRRVSEAIRDKCATELEKVINVFNMVDSDDSGTISKREMRQAMFLLGLDLSADEVDALYRVIDADGSGDVSYEEFVRVAKGEDAVLGALRRPKSRSSERHVTVADDIHLAFRHGKERKVPKLLKCPCLPNIPPPPPAPKDPTIYHPPAGVTIGGEFYEADTDSEDERELRGTSKDPDLVTETKVLDFLIGTIHRQIKRDRGTVVSAFKTIDKDASGSVDRDELEKALLLLNLDVRERESRLLFDHCDADRSGTIGMQEFLKAVKTYIWEGIRREREARELAEIERREREHRRRERARLRREAEERERLRLKALQDAMWKKAVTAMQACWRGYAARVKVVRMRAELALVRHQEHVLEIERQQVRADARIQAEKAKYAEWQRQRNLVEEQYKSVDNTQAKMAKYREDRTWTFLHEGERPDPLAPRGTEHVWIEAAPNNGNFRSLTKRKRKGRQHVGIMGSLDGSDRHIAADGTDLRVHRKGRDERVMGKHFGGPQNALHGVHFDPAGRDLLSHKLALGISIGDTHCLSSGEKAFRPHHTASANEIDQNAAAKTIQSQVRGRQARRQIGFKSGAARSETALNLLNSAASNERLKVLPSTTAAARPAIFVMEDGDVGRTFVDQSDTSSVPGLPTQVSHDIQVFGSTDIQSERSLVIQSESSLVVQGRSKLRQPTAEETIFKMASNLIDGVLSSTVSKLCRLGNRSPLKTREGPAKPTVHGGHVMAAGVFFADADAHMTTSTALGEWDEDSGGETTAGEEEELLAPREGPTPYEVHSSAVNNSVTRHADEEAAMRSAFGLMENFPGSGKIKKRHMLKEVATNMRLQRLIRATAYLRPLLDLTKWTHLVRDWKSVEPDALLFGEFEAFLSALPLLITAQSTDHELKTKIGDDDSMVASAQDSKHVASQRPPLAAAATDAANVVELQPRDSVGVGMAKLLFSLVDVDGSQQITRQELLVALNVNMRVRAILKTSALLRPLLDPATFSLGWSVIDADSDNIISYTELCSILEASEDGVDLDDNVRELARKAGVWSEGTGDTKTPQEVALELLRKAEEANRQEIEGRAKVLAEKDSARRQAKSEREAKERKLAEDKRARIAELSKLHPGTVHLFSMLDLDGDGRISVSEILQVMDVSNVKFFAARECVSNSEYLRPLLHQNAYLQVLAEMDSDGDGSVSAEEFDTFFKNKRPELLEKAKRRNEEIALKRFTESKIANARKEFGWLVKDNTAAKLDLALGSLIKCIGDLAKDPTVERFHVIEQDPRYQRTLAPAEMFHKRVTKFLASIGFRLCNANHVPDKDGRYFVFDPEWVENIERWSYAVIKDAVHVMKNARKKVRLDLGFKD